MITVPSFGLHVVAGGISILVQNDRVDHVTGIDLNLDVQVGLSNPRNCPHSINLEARSDGPLLSHELIQFMLPLPKQLTKPLFLPETATNKLLLTQLLRLSSSNTIASWVPSWTLTKNQFILKLLSLTNLSPLIIHGFNHRHSRMIDYISNLVPIYPRPVIVMGDSWVIPRNQIEDLEPLHALDFKTMRLEEQGAEHLYQRMVSSAS